VPLFNFSFETRFIVPRLLENVLRASIAITVSIHYPELVVVGQEAGDF
jgi:hypothetical protein